MRSPLLPVAVALAATALQSRSATVVSPGDPGAIPGVSSFSYDHYYVLGDDHLASFVDDTDAYSWDHPNLASSDPALGNQTGWTHLTRWVAFTLTAPADLTIRLERTSGVMFPDQGNPGEFVAAGDDLVPAFTLWEGFEVLAETAGGGPGNPLGGHRWDNDGDETAWMDQLVYFAHEGNLGGASFVEQTFSLAAGNYTINFAGNQGGAFDAGTVPGDLRKGFAATFTTVVPEPGSALLALLGLAIPALRRRR